MKYLLLIAMIVLVGCEIPPKDTHNSSPTELRIETVDSCEYVVYTSFNKGGLAHHGACNNPIHKNNN
jgi:hypothetical protein